MRCLRAWVMALSLCAVSAIMPISQAIAQNQDNDYGGGSRLGPRRAQINQSGTDAARVVLQDFAQCLYARRPSSAERFMALPVDTKEYASAKKTLFDTLGDSCIEGDGSLQFSPSLLRGALFEAAYRKKFASQAPVAFVAEAEVSVAANYARPYSEDARKQIILQDFAMCVVKAAPSGARLLILTSPGTSRESIALTAISGHLGPCLTKDQKVELSKPSLRGIMAEALYRMSTAMPVVGKVN